jgi:hypothetical protein
MYKFLFTLLLSCIFFTIMAQDLNELEKRYGFKDIRLESPIDSVKGTKLKKEFKERNEFPAKLYTVENADYNRIGEVKIKRVELKTYKDLIYEISLSVDKDPRVMKALESLFGQAEYDAKNETYFWKTDNLILKFRPEGKGHLELLYTSFVIHKMMKEDKKKKVDDIANDF